MKHFLKKLIDQLAVQAKHEQVVRLVVGAVIAKDDKVLCLKRAAHDFMAGIYELPSGKVESDETLPQALLREVAEESNLKINEITDYLGSFDYQSRSGMLTRQFNFLVSYDDAQSIVLNPAEHEGYAWVSRHELGNYNISAEVKKIIELHYLRQMLNISTVELTQIALEAGIQRFVVGAVVSKDDNKKALIMKRSSDDFMGGMDELPSGKVNPNETLEMALSRELKEETGLEITRINSYLGHFDYESKSGIKTRQFTFSVKVIFPIVVQISAEHEGFAWMSSNEINRYQLSGEVKEQLKSFFQKPQLELHAESDFFSGNKKRKQPDEIDVTDTSSPVKKPDNRLADDVSRDTNHNYQM